ncbi:MAG: rhodanese-like domain-containing protein [Bacteroidetes bacterium]|nr:rhodanese-like domain-containing protein [Bacteroidota bacterium]
MIRIWVLSFFTCFGGVLFAQQNMQAVEFNQKLKSDKTAVILDVRSPGEYAEGHLDKALNIDVNATDFLARTSKLDKQKTYYVYCLAGVRSDRAAESLRKRGYKAISLNGGIKAWSSAGYPVVKTGNK